MKFRRLLFGFIPVLMLFASLTACTNMFTYTGSTVREDITVHLKEGGPHTERWSHDRVSIPFSYEKSPNSLHIWGEVNLDFNWNSVDHLFVQIHFVDENNKIIGSEVIAVAPYRQGIDDYPFDETFEVPVGTVAFSYDGEVSGVSDDGSWSFWLDPRKGGW